MAISTSLSTVTVTGFAPDGTIRPLGPEADGGDYAILEVTIRDASGAPIPNVQVLCGLDSTTPDPTALLTHDTARPNRLGPVSTTGADGKAQVEIRSQAAGASPLTVNVFAGESDGRIRGRVRPTTTSVGAQSAPDTTVATALTITESANYVNTRFEGQVTIGIEAVTFTNCTFDVAPTAGANCVRAFGRTGVRFTNCTFTGSSGPALIGYGFRVERCLFEEIGTSGIAVTAADPELGTRVERCLIHRFALEAPAPAVNLAPAAEIDIVESLLDGPHPDSPRGITGYDMRGAVWALGRLPGTVSAITIEGNWLFGGENSTVLIQALDGAAIPSRIRIVGNRFGDPEQSNKPGAAHSPITIEAEGTVIQGNTLDDTGVLLTSTNELGGVAWYPQLVALDSTATVTFVEPDTATATVELGLTSPGTPESVAIPSVALDTRYVNALRPAGIPTGVVYPGPEFLEDDSFFADMYPAIPEAIIYPASRGEGSPTPDPAVVQFADGPLSITRFENVGTVNLPIVSSIAATQDIVVTYSITGTATAGGVDFSAPSSVTILQGLSSVNLPLTIIEDSILDQGETIIVSIETASGANIGDRRVYQVILSDYLDEFGAVLLPKPNMGTTFIRVEEGNAVAIPVTLAQSVGAPTTVTYTLEDVGLLPGEYTDETGGSVVIAAGQTSADIEITINDDTDVEGVETLTVRLTGASGGAPVLGSNTTCIVAVLDNDIDPTVELDFAQSTDSLPEGVIRTYSINVTGPLNTTTGEITVPFTLTEGTGLTSADYEILDITTGDPLTSPFVIPDGSTGFAFNFRAVDDATTESSETLTITLGTPTGNAVIGAGDTLELTILDNDSPAGLDGDLYGLIPERQVVDLTSPDIEVYPDRYEILENIPLGISASTVLRTGLNDSIAQAMKAAETIWAARNSASIAALQAFAARFDEGDPVLIRVNGDCYPQSLDLGGGNVSSGQTVTWTRPIVRDLVVYGATGNTTDGMGEIAFFWRQADGITSGTYAGRSRIVANIRFERLKIEGNPGNSRCVNGIGEGDPSITDRHSGAFKFYDCHFARERVPSTAFFGRGLKWTIRAASIRAAWDMRGCLYDLAEEHGFYINSPLSEDAGVPSLVFLNNVQERRGGFGRSFAQIVNRPNEVPGPTAAGTMVFMRNVSWDNASDEIQSGAGDYTVVGNDGDIYFVENESRGKARTPNSGAARASITVWCDSNRDFQKGVYRITRAGQEFVNGAVHIWGHTIAYEDGMDRGAIGVSSAPSLEIRAFRATGCAGQSVLHYDRYEESMEFGMGIPADDPSFGLKWDLRWPTWQDAPWTGPVSSYPGWDPTTSKIRSGRSRRLGNYNQEDRILSNAEVDAYTGEALWPEGNRLPAGRWQVGVTGIPAGGTVTIYVGDFQNLRSQREQTWTYQRRLENTDTGRFTEARTTDLITFDGVTSSGSMVFTLMDDEFNNENALNGLPNERPAITVTNTGGGIVAGQPGIVRYEITDFGANAFDAGVPICDVYIYSVGSYGTFEWDPVRYPAQTATVSLSNPSEHFVWVVTSAPTFMPEIVYVFKNVGLTTTPATGINNSEWAMVQGASETSVRLVGLETASVGETLVLDIDAVEINGTTAGTVGARSRLTITFVP